MKSFASQAAPKVDNVMNASLKGEDGGSFAAHLQSNYEKYLKDETLAYSRKKDQPKTPEEIEKVNNELKAKAEAKLVNYVNGTLKPAYQDAIEGKSPNKENMADIQKMIGGVTSAGSLLSGNGGIMGMIGAVGGIMASFGEYIGAFFQAMKSEPDTTFGERFSSALQDAKSEKTMGEFAKNFGFDLNGLKSDLLRNWEAQPQVAAAPTPTEAEKKKAEEAAKKAVTPNPEVKVSEEKKPEEPAAGAKPDPENAKKEGAGAVRTADPVTPAGGSQPNGTPVPSQPTPPAPPGAAAAPARA